MIHGLHEAWTCRFLMVSEQMVWNLCTSHMMIPWIGGALTASNFLISDLIILFLRASKNATYRDGFHFGPRSDTKGQLWFHRYMHSFGERRFMQSLGAQGGCQAKCIFSCSASWVSCVYEFAAFPHNDEQKHQSCKSSQQNICKNWWTQRCCEAPKLSLEPIQQWQKCFSFTIIPSEEMMYPRNCTLVNF